MPLAGFEPTIPVFKRANTFHALDRAATVTGTASDYGVINEFGAIGELRFGRGN
jgi:hypothetical protein